MAWSLGDKMILIDRLMAHESAVTELIVNYLLTGYREEDIDLFSDITKRELVMLIVKEASNHCLSDIEYAYLPKEEYEF